ncbi:MAG: UvrD/REP helicase [Candidatus Roizmanbacteria bacterium GW2011_GWB1_40_7]|uniref:UvrD/REP helicase n=2 Tax=Candidatus Roizmaniibacteriota TaxID=1752723 RepID=A0A0G0T4H7_9BACT|nr:MAG: UvrD/REP helicase [Candidatus Roizmanbacteria bacterium GW2011_GWB1_40_7]KKR93945.1 MAG: UvrD/REP helicase [Candidatus Roizmanbacteria bacterium GW2011_GWA1_41_13]
MKVIADLQLHSKYSRAVSQKMNIEELFFWSKMKGIGLIATGDWTHPLWIREIKEKLVETGRGTLRLNSNLKKTVFSNLFSNLKRQSFSLQEQDTEFLLATELSSIYSQGGQTRRVHNLVWVPAISSAEKIIRELNKRGCNLGADGRPIVGLTSKEVLQIALEVDESALVIPAHAWTPWFALYGSKSGFNSIEECFEDLSDYIYAVETGLSSDPAMNWRIPELDHRSIVSFSDAHSGPKLGREATVFDLEELSYEAIREAVMDNASNLSSPRRRGSVDSRLLGNDRNKISCTLEFYPEEGKYHFDGHRNCKVRQTPEETRERGTQCPVCGRPLTVGVEYRVQELAKRDPINTVKKIDDNGVRWLYHPQNMHPPFVNIVPLLEIISEARHAGTGSKGVQEEYEKVISSLGPEFHVLLKADFDDISRASDARLSEAIKKVRVGDIYIDPGYDGEFGKVKVWKDDGEDVVEDVGKDQMSLF